MSTPAPRVPLSRERVLRAALELSDRSGVSSLSMREIARTLGVGVMSLYNHVANKDDVLSGITDLVASEFALPSGPDWKLALRNSAISAHDALLRHPWACTTMSSGMTTLGPERLAFYDALVGTLRKAGFSPGMARQGFLALDGHILGFTQQEAALPQDLGDRADLTRSVLHSLPTDAHPYMHEMVSDLLASGQYEFPYDFVLDLILDGLERAPRD